MVLLRPTKSRSNRQIRHCQQRYHALATRPAESQVAAANHSRRKQDMVSPNHVGRNALTVVYYSVQCFPC